MSKLPKCFESYGEVEKDHFNFIIKLHDLIENKCTETTDPVREFCSGVVKEIKKMFLPKVIESDPRFGLETIDVVMENMRSLIWAE